TDVEAAVADYWTRVSITEGRMTAVRHEVMGELMRRHRSNQADLERQEKHKKDLQNQQGKLIEMRYAEAITLEQLKSELERIARELAGTEQLIETYSMRIETVLAAV